MRRRSPVGRRGLVLLGSASGGITFLVLWGDGAEIGRAVLSGLAMAIWLVGFIAALNWYNQYRQRQVADIISQIPTGPEGDSSWDQSDVTEGWDPLDDPDGRHGRSDQ